jgi:hypothetical protein
MARAANKKATSATKRKTVDAVTPAAGRSSMAKAKTGKRAATAAGRAPKLRAHPAPVTNGDVARRAYALYLARGCAHGRDVDDWLQAEHDLREAKSSTEA